MNINGITVVMREIPQHEILDLVNCAVDYGHCNSVCMGSLYEFAKPVTDDDIEQYSNSLTDKDGYGDEDRESSTGRLKEWRLKFGA